MGKHPRWFIFWNNNIGNIESLISNNIWDEIKLKVEQQGPTKIKKQCKANLRALKNAYKKAEDNNVKTEATPLTRSFYNDIHVILGTWDIVELSEIREVGVNEDDHINPRGSITKDTENQGNIFHADNTHDEKKDTTGKENVAGGNTVTDYSETDLKFKDDKVLSLHTTNL